MWTLVRALGQAAAMTRVYLVRHAVHDLVGRVLVGRTPGIGLSAKGIVQATGLRERFRAEPLARLLSSPVQRALETAEVIAAPTGRLVEIVDDLAELDCGAWTGMAFDDLADDPRWHLWNHERARSAIPDGESMAVVQRRATGLLDRLSEAEPADPILLVSHSDVIKAMIIALLGMSLNDYGRFDVDPASITTVDLWGPGAGKVVRLNEVVRP